MKMFICLIILVIAVLLKFWPGSNKKTLSEKNEQSSIIPLLSNSPKSPSIYRKNNNLKKTENDKKFSKSPSKVTKKISNSKQSNSQKPLSLLQVATQEERAEMDLLKEHELIELAIYFLKKEHFKFEKAEKYLNMSISKNPENHMAVNELMALYTTNRGEDKANQLINELSERNPTSPVIADALGNWNTFLKNYDDAAENYERALELQGYNENLQRKLAVVYLKNSQPEKAVKTFRTILLNLKNKPDKTKRQYTMIELANALIKSGQCTESQNILAQTQDKKLKPSLDLVQKRYKQNCGS